jgi:hypothetical protein
MWHKGLWLRPEGRAGLSLHVIVPLSALLSHATESVTAKTGDAVGWLFNAALGHLTELWNYDTITAWRKTSLRHARMPRRLAPDGSRLRKSRSVQN